MAVIVEVLNKQLKVIERHRFSQPRIGLGRAYNNDVILYNKHICAHHAELVQTADGQWQLRDLNSLNGSFLTGTRLNGEPAMLASGQLCWLGEQAIRLYDEHHPVVAAQPYNQLEQRLQKFGHLGLIMLLALCLLAAELFGLWLQSVDSRQGRWTQELANLPLMLLGVSLWPALLALWAKLNQHEPRFLPQLGITFVMLVLMELWQAAMALLNFSLDGATAVVWLSELGQVALIVLMLAANFYLALQLAPAKKLAIAAALGLLINLQGVAFNLLQDDDQRLLPHYDNSLMPLPFYLNRPLSHDEFLQQSSGLFRQTAETAAAPLTD